MLKILDQNKLSEYKVIPLSTGYVILDGGEKIIHSNIDLKDHGGAIGLMNIGDTMVFPFLKVDILSALGYAGSLKRKTIAPITFHRDLKDWAKQNKLIEEV